MMLVGSAAATALARAPIVRMTSEAPRPARWKPGEIAPKHLTGALAGDAGFDPLLLTALAKKPVMDLVTGGWPSMAQREIMMANLSPDE